MGYITHIAIKHFKEAPDGTRLYYPYGSLFRPLVVPDPITEQRFFRKQKQFTWAFLEMIAFEILTLNLIGSAALLKAPLSFIGFLAVFLAIYFAVHQVLLNAEIRRLAVYIES